MTKSARSWLASGVVVWIAVGASFAQQQATKQQATNQQPAISHNVPSAQDPEHIVHILFTKEMEQKYRAQLKTPLIVQNLQYNGGPVMRNPTNFLIFWQPPGRAAFPAGYQAGMERYFQNLGGTPLYNIVTEYGDSTAKPVPNSTSLGAPSYTDTTTAPPSGNDGSIAHPLTDGDIQNEVSVALAANPQWGPANVNNEYFVFTPSDTDECMNPSSCFAINGGSNGAFCAYHGNFGGNTIYAYAPFAASAGGCYGASVFPNSAALDVTLTAVSHEMFESNSDPFLNAWFDASGNEIGDKCNRVFGYTSPDGTNIVLNGDRFQIQQEWSNDVSACAKRYGPTPTTSLASLLDFGTVCPGSTIEKDLVIQNSGNGALDILNIRLAPGSDPSFTLLNVPPTAATLQSSESLTIQVQFSPTAALIGARTATVIVDTDDPSQTTYTTGVTGSSPSGTINTVMGGGGNYGGVCIGSFEDLPLTVNNSGKCSLSLNTILSGDPEFATANVVNYPVSIGAGASLQIPIRFKPTLPTGTKNTSLDVASSDLVNPNQFVPLTGQSQAPLVSVTGTSNFGNVCAGVVQDETFKVCNLPVAGTCQLNVTNVSLSAGCKDFTIVSNPFPEYLGAEVCGNVVVQFTPTSDGTKTCNLIVSSSDPATPTDTIPLTGTTPIPSISISPALAFPPTVEGNGRCAVTDPFPVTNTGICPLTVTGVTLGPSNPEDYGLHDLPKQTNVLAPGASLSQGGFGIRFQPVELNRNVDSSVDVTYISDPILKTKTTVDTNLCGEGVYVGARVLVTLGGIPVGAVDQIQLIQLSTNTVVDSVSHATLKTVTPLIATCAPFQYHREYGTVSDSKALAPGAYEVKVTLTVSGHQEVKTATFTDNSCGFAHPVVVAF